MLSIFFSFSVGLCEVKAVAVAKYKTRILLYGFLSWTAVKYVLVLQNYVSQVMEEEEKKKEFEIVYFIVKKNA